LGNVPGEPIIRAVTDVRILRDHGLYDDEFADRVDKRIEAVGAHADGRVRHRGLGCLHLAAECPLDVGGAGHARPDKGLAYGNVPVFAGGGFDVLPRGFAIRHEDIAEPPPVADAPRARQPPVQSTAEVLIGRRHGERRARTCAIERLYHGLERVARLKGQVGGSAGEADVALTDAGEQVLRQMPEPLDLAQPEEGRGALDGVECAEDRIDRLAVVRIRLEGEDRRLGGHHVVHRLGDEFAEKVEVGVLWERRRRRKALGSRPLIRRRGILPLGRPGAGTGTAPGMIGWSGITGCGWAGLPRFLP